VVGDLQQRLGRNLRRLRVQQGLSQEHFAEVLKIHRTYVGGLERGERNPSLQVIERLAEELGVDPVSLLVEDAADAGTDAATLRAAQAGAGEPPDARTLPASRPRPDV
jgi:transcriptional regulator with XRE-family HTH domain